MSFNFDPSQFRINPTKKKPMVGDRPAIGNLQVPEAPTLEAPPQRDMAGESRQRLQGSLIAAAVAALLSPRRVAGSVASFLRGGQAGADAKYADSVADVERTNRAAMSQYGANQQRFGNELRLDETGYRRGRDEVGDQWRERSWDRQGEQIAYGRGRDQVGDDRWKQDFAMRGDQVARRNMESDRNWTRTQGLDEKSQAMQGLTALGGYERYITPLEDKSQSAFRLSATPFLQKLGVTPPTEPLRLAPKPVDPYKMGYLQLQRDKLGQLNFHQNNQAKHWSAQDGNAAGNLRMRGAELDLRQSIAQFDQELKAAQMSGITPETALRLSIQAQGYAGQTFDPADKKILQDISKSLRVIAGGELPEAPASAPGISPYVLPSSPGGQAPIRGIVPPTPTVGRTNPLNPDPGYRPPSKKLVAPGTVGGKSSRKVEAPRATPKATEPMRGAGRSSIKASEKKRLTKGF